jgi:hypothetical protein
MNTGAPLTHSPPQHPNERVSDQPSERVSERVSEGVTDDRDQVFTSLDTHFSFKVFIQQLFFHIFFPLTVPLAWSLYGVKHARIQGYHYSDKPFMSYLLTIIPSLCIWASVSVYCTQRVGMLQLQLQLPLDMMQLPVGMFLLQRMMIAVKYASLSPYEYR